LKTLKRKDVQKQVLVLIFILLALLMSACGSDPPPTATATPTVISPIGTPEPESTTSSGGGIGDVQAGDISTSVAGRTPVPTPTPGIIDREIEKVSEATGLAGKTFLGLTTEDWLSLAFSALIVLIGYFVSLRLLNRGLKWVARRLGNKLDDSFLNGIVNELKWLLLLYIIKFAILRLDFLNDRLRTGLDDVFFILEMVIIASVAIRVIDLLVQWYKDNLEPEEDRAMLAPVLTMVRRLSDFLVIVLILSIALSHFGVDISALAATLFAIAVIVALGARSSVADVLSGFTILITQPFRVGDSIELIELGTSGDVLSISTLTTRIRLGDNREVFVPNSMISGNQVINYTYPDPRHRVQTDIDIAYGSDPDKVRQVITDAARGVEGVLSEKPVDVFYLKFGDSARLVRVRWWIDNFDHRNTMLDKVNAALESALDDAGIDMPNTTYDLNVNTVEGADQEKPIPSETSEKQTSE
jgi:small-conductance mechanosensitive channel